MNESLVAALVGFVGCGIGGALAPYLIRMLPEPPPDPEPEEGVELTAAQKARLEEPPKELYAALGRRPRLGLLAGAISAVAGAGVGAALGSHWVLPLLLALVPVGTLLGIVDHRTRLLPSIVVLPATVVALVWGGIRWATTGDADDFVRGLICLVVVRSIFWVLWFIRQAGLGFGDVRLAALIGCAVGFLGRGELVIGLFAAFLLFMVPGLGLLVLAIVRRDRKILKKAVPFGPFLLLGAWIGIVVGEPVVSALYG